MKRLLVLFILAALSVVSIATDRTGAIRPGMTGLSTPMVFTVADAIDASQTVNITVTNGQKYLQFQTFTVTLDNISGAPSVVCTAYGKVNLADEYVAIGDAATLSADGTATITAATPCNYNYLKLALVASGAPQHSHITAFTVKTANAYDIPANSGTLTISRATAGAVTITTKDDNAVATSTVYRAGSTGPVVFGSTDGTTAIASSDWAIGVTGALTGIGAITMDGLLTAGAAINVKGAINQAIAGGTVVTSAGLLGGGGTATNATQTLGAAGGKAFSYYLSSTSTTASHVLQGYYMNVNYGTSGASAAPSGDVIRGRAWLVGDASGTSALTGGAFSVELAATTASNTGLTAGLRGNVVLPDGVLTNTGTYAGTMAELYLSGAATDTRAYTIISPLSVNISGTAPTDPAQLSNVSFIDFNLPANEIGDALIVDDASSANTVGAKLKIKINGTVYWILLADSHD
jgi:hypothetical protein